MVNVMLHKVFSPHYVHVPAAACLSWWAWQLAHMLIKHCVLTRKPLVFTFTWQGALVARGLMTGLRALLAELLFLILLKCQFMLNCLIVVLNCINVSCKALLIALLPKCAWWINLPFLALPSQKYPPQSRRSCSPWRGGLCGSKYS